MTKRAYINVGEITVDPIPFIEINSMEIIKEINSHTIFTVEGRIEEAEKEKLDDMAGFGTEIVVRRTDNTVLFRGLLSELVIEEEAAVFTVKVRACSHTILLDRIKQTRPFHMGDRTLDEMIRVVTEATPKAQVIINERCSTNIGQLMMQYEETDWQFIKRMASSCGQGLFPDSRFDYPAYFVGKSGLPDEEKLESDIPYKVCWKERDGGFEQSQAPSITYVMEINNVWLEPGESVIFKGMKLCVKSLRINLKQAMLTGYYELCPIAGLDIPGKYNDALAGKAVMGTVQEIDRDFVYVRIITADGNGYGDGCWFPYSTIYSSSDGSGWYCMPEPGDKVRIQFPDADEKNAYAVSSVSEYESEGNNDNRMSDYTKRYIRNKQGMQVTWTPDRVIVSSNGACLIDINQNGTLFLSANSKIVIRSGNDVVIDAGNQININAGNGVRINCGAKAEINMDKDGVIELKGNEIYTN